MTTPEVKRWREMAEAATEGPWERMTNDKNDQAVIGARGVELATLWHHCVGALEREMEANATFIAASREAIPAMAKMIEEREAEIERLRESKEILDGIGLALESFGYAHMTNAAGIMSILHELDEARAALGRGP